MPRYYPAFIDLQGRLAVVIGGGEVAVRKVEMLAASGAKVRVISPEFQGELETWGREGRVELVRRSYQVGDLEGAAICVAATDDEEVNQAVSAEGRSRGVLVNVVDRPALCDFIVPSVVARGDLLIAISTGGAGPVLSRRIREELERRFGPEYGEFVKLLEEARPRILGSEPDYERRKRLFEAIVDSAELLALICEGDLAGARKRLDELLADTTSR